MWEEDLGENPGNYPHLSFLFLKFFLFFSGIRACLLSCLDLAEYTEKWLHLSPIIAFKPFHPGLYLEHAPLISIKFSIFKCSYFYILKSLDQSKLKLLSKSFHRSKSSSFFQLQPDSVYQLWSKGRLWSVLSLFLCHIPPIPSLALSFFQVNVGR